MRNISLAIKIPIFIALFSAMLSFPVLLTTNHQQIKSLESNFYSNQETLLNVIIPDAREALETGMYSYFQDRINQLSERTDIFSIELRNDNNTIIASVRDDNGGNENSSVRMTHKIHTITSRKVLGIDRLSPSLEQFIGTITIEFNNAEKQKKLNAIKTQLWAFTLTTIIMVLACIFIVNFFITKPIAIMGKALIDIQKGNFHPEIPVSGKDEMGILSETILKTGMELEQREKDKLAEYDRQISEYTERSNQDIRKITRIRDSLEELRASARLGFDLSSVLFSRKESKEASILLTNALESIATINNMQGEIEDENISHRRFCSETLKNYAISIEKTVAFIACTVRFPIQIIIDKGITDSNRHILVDLKSTMRLFSLALDYWPKALETDDNPWFITVSIEENLGKEKSIMIEFLTNDAAPYAIVSVAKKPSWEACDPVLRKIENLEETDGIHQLLSIKSDTSIAIQYVCDYIDSESASGILHKYKNIFKFNRRVLLLGESPQLLNIGKRLETLHIDTIKTTYNKQELIENIIDHNTAIILIDCATSAENMRMTMTLLSGLRSAYKFMIVAVVNDKELLQIENGNFELHEIMGIDHVISYPVSTEDIGLLINGMSSDEIISHAIKSIQDDIK